ncbi:MAG: ribonuclease H-like domain-containing protein [Proteobacteria bacterium]|nr:ribonuclease H-like domain-containing protein [Pseudomonadota bacterium]MBU1058844.1 ribonuclease H-like domain-containing protein [Pseudomonadota bacterium]
MLTHTFVHLPGIGKKTEEVLWQAGIQRWNQWQTTPPVKLPNSSLPELNRLLQHSAEELQKGPAFFSSRLPANEQWRLFSHFRQQTAYLDIETTGLGPQAEITTITLYDGRRIRCYINGRNLDDFARDIWDYEILVTYNGRGFDIPVIERCFRIKLSQAHIDLRFILAKLGFTGGLKGCEKQLGIERGELDGVNGSFAVLLWQDYKNSNNERALETLLSYNIEDTVNLERLLVEAYNRNLLQTPFAANLLLPLPASPAIPYQPDVDSVKRIRSTLLKNQCGATSD